MNIDELRQKKCSPCLGDEPSLTDNQVRNYLALLGSDWQIDQSGNLFREFRLEDFKQALELTNKIGELAEAENHHPDLLLRWGSLSVILFTHSIKALSENDFILAAKINQLTEE